MSTRWWFPSFCYWDVWVFSFLFWSIFYRLCTYHYCTSSVVFFSPLDVCFLLSTTYVHSLVAFANHSDSSMGCCTWSRFFISSTHHNYCTFVTNRFVVDDNSFVLGLLYYRWLSFRCHEYSLHSVFTWFLLIICFCFFYYFCSHWPCWFDGWVPILHF